MNDNDSPRNRGVGDYRERRPSDADFEFLMSPACSRR